MNLQLKSSSAFHTEKESRASKVAIEKSPILKHESTRSSLDYLISPLSLSPAEDKVVNCEEERNSLPRFDIHLSSPQIQLHSKATGGSIIFAMQGAYVEGKKGVNLIWKGC